MITLLNPTTVLVVLLLELWFLFDCDNFFFQASTIHWVSDLHINKQTDKVLWSDPYYQYDHDCVLVKDV